MILATEYQQTYSLFWDNKIREKWCKIYTIDLGPLTYTLGDVRAQGSKFRLKSLSLSHVGLFIFNDLKTNGQPQPKIYFLGLIQPHSTNCKSCFLINFKNFSMEE